MPLATGEPGESAALIHQLTKFTNSPNYGSLLRRGGRRFAAALRPCGLAAAALVGGLAAVAGRLGLDRLLHVAAADPRGGDARREQPDRAQRVVVAGDDEVDFVGVAVGVDDPDHRDLQ